MREDPLKGGQFFKGGSILLPPRNRQSRLKRKALSNQRPTQNQSTIFQGGDNFLRGWGAKKGTRQQKGTGPKITTKTKILYFRCLDALPTKTTNIEPGPKAGFGTKVGSGPKPGPGSSPRPGPRPGPWPGPAQAWAQGFQNH